MKPCQSSIVIGLDAWKPSEKVTNILWDPGAPQLLFVLEYSRVEHDAIEGVDTL
jgi:hypothetical protein